MKHGDFANCFFDAQVSVRILGGLMVLGYEIGTVMKRTTKVYTDDNITIKFDDIENMPHQYIQVQLVSLLPKA